MRVRADPRDTQPLPVTVPADHLVPSSFFFRPRSATGLATANANALAATEPDPPPLNPLLRGATARALHGGSFTQVLQALVRNATPQTMLATQRLSTALTYQLAPFGLVADASCGDNHCAFAIARVPANQLAAVSQALQPLLPANAMLAVIEGRDGEQEIRYWLADAGGLP